jgi:RND family efflux transporter MFP subunit
MPGWLIPAVLVVAAVVAAALLVPPLLRPKVTVTEPTRGPVVQAFYATGTVQPQRDYPVRANVAGVLAEVAVDKGERVTAGQVLAVVDAPDLRFAVDRAQAELAEKLARLDEPTSPVLQDFDARIRAVVELQDIARREQERLSGLAGTGGASSVDVDRAIDRVKTLWSEQESLKAQRAAKVLELQREVAVAQAAVSTARWNLEQARLKSPTDGVVLDRPTPQGTRVAVNDTLMRVADVAPERLVLRAAVDEEDIAAVREGMLTRMTLYSFPGRVFTGRVQRVYNEADPTRRTFEVDVAMDEPDERLSPNMTGELAFILAEKADATILPALAAQGDAVLVVRGDRVERVPATFGLRSVDRVELTSDLPADARVIISVVDEGIVGRHVRATYVNPQAANGLTREPTTPMKGLGGGGR